MRVGVDHFEQEMVLPAVQAVLHLPAFAGDARPDDLRQAVDVDRLDAEPRLDVAAHGVGPRLGAEDAGVQRQFTDVDAHAFGDFGDVERVRRRGAEDMGAKVLQQRDLPLGAAAGQRHHGAAEPLGAVMRAKTAGEEAVTIGVVHDLAGPSAHAGEAARHQVGPQIEIRLGVAHDGRFPGRSRRGVQAQQLVARHGEHAERIIVAQVGLHREGKAREIGERLEIGRFDVRRVELLLVVRHLRIGALERGLEPGKLQRLQFVARHGLGRGLEHEAGRICDGVLGTHDLSLPVEFLELCRAAALVARRNFPAHGELQPGLTAGPGTPNPRMGVWGSAKP